MQAGMQGKKKAQVYETQGLVWIFSHG